MCFIMRIKRPSQHDMNNASSQHIPLGTAFAAAAEALALFCRLRSIDAADMPADQIDTLLDLAFEEAAQLAAQQAAHEEARRAG
jgi:hypothetical protein